MEFQIRSTNPRRTIQPTVIVRTFFRHVDGKQLAVRRVSIRTRMLPCREELGEIEKSFYLLRLFTTFTEHYWDDILKEEEEEADQTSLITYTEKTSVFESCAVQPD